MFCNYQMCKWNTYKSGCLKPFDEPCPKSKLETSVKPQSNADRIRAMSDDELAKVLNAFTAYFEECNRRIAEVDCKDCELCEICSLGEGKALKWLQQPAEQKVIKKL